MFLFFIGIILEDVDLNWLDWFLFFIIVEDLVILIGCMIFLSPFLDFIKISMLIVSFLLHLDPELFPGRIFSTSYNFNGF